MVRECLQATLRPALSGGDGEQMLLSPTVLSDQIKFIIHVLTSRAETRV